MSSRSLRRSVVILALAALLVPAVSLHAASRPQPAPAASSAPHHNPVLEFLLRLFSGANSLINAGLSMDGNG